MWKRSPSFALVDMLALCAMIILIGLLLVSVTSRLREYGRRSVCAMNLAGIGASSKIYAMDNEESWMVPAFSGSAYNQGGNGIDYLNDDGTVGDGAANTDPGEVGYLRQSESTSDALAGGNSGSTAVSVTRAFWMLVRSGDVSVKQFICPSSGDTVDASTNLDLYYDFEGYTHVSYGYLVPWGPRDTRPREAGDHRVVYAADKGPYFLAGADPTAAFNTGGADGGPIGLDDPPEYWRPFNSPNHGGVGNGQGQNCLFGDGRVSFELVPTVGVDHDNIYTLMLDDWEQLAHSRIFGDSPHISAARNPYPGDEALGPNPFSYASTDSLIYP